jgi:acid phosphatase
MLPQMQISCAFILVLIAATATANEFAINSCKSPLLAFAPPNPAAPRNLDEARADVVTYYENGSYDRDMDAAHEQARMFFDAITPPLNATVVFDIDETSLSNYEAIKEQDFGYGRCCSLPVRVSCLHVPVCAYMHRLSYCALWQLVAPSLELCHTPPSYIPTMNDKWVHTGSAPAINQTLATYRMLLQRGFRVVFLTGRSHVVADITATNLKRVGYAQYNALITRSDSELNLTAAVFKTNRRAQLTEQGYNIVANFGDQWSDVVGDCSGFRVKLPNYIYLVQ